MFKTLRKIYRKPYMKRPTVHMSFLKVLLVLVAALLWQRIVNDPYHGIGFAFSILGIAMILFCWFYYLGLDGISVHHLLEEKQTKKKRSFFFRDMIDFVNEKVIPYEELDREERLACRLVSNFLVGLLFTIIGIFVP